MYELNTICASELEALRARGECTVAGRTSPLAGPAPGLLGVLTTDDLCAALRASSAGEDTLACPNTELLLLCLDFTEPVDGRGDLPLLSADDITRRTL